MKAIIRLEVVFCDDGSAKVFRWYHVNGYRQDRISKNEEFVVQGKNYDYVVTGLDTYEQARNIAKWYHGKLTSGQLGRHRLD